MKPIRFEHTNITYAENQPEYLPLPVHKSRDGTVTSCWQMSWRERLRVAVTGRFFISVLTFNRPLQPILPATEFTPPEEPGTFRPHGNGKVPTQIPPLQSGVNQ